VTLKLKRSGLSVEQVFDRILIGVDGREGGHDAIALAGQLASDGAHVALAHVYGAGLMPGRGAALLLEGERGQTLELLERERARTSLDAELLLCAEHSVGRGLRQLATSHGSDLLVVGRRHHGLFGRAFHSDDTSAALNGTPCPIAVAPPGYAERAAQLLRVGVGYDGSPESTEAIAAARALAARQGGATVRALAVTRRDDAAPALPDVGEDIELETVPGLSSEVLERFSDELDLLVVGSRSNGPLGRVFNGSTSSYLARNARCGLLVLPRGAIARDRAQDEDCDTAVA
jgi:nucleotide-binding universal stress UspA family protein